MEKGDNALTGAELDQIVENLDYAHNEKINYTEFMAASIDVRQIVSKDEDKLAAIFNQFDIDNSGQITRENLKKAFSKYGREITDADLD